MREFIGDERLNRSPLHRLFEDSEQDLALDYLVQTHNEGFQLVGLDKTLQIDSEDMRDFVDTIYRSFMQAMYGVNLPTIANMWKVQNTFIDKYYPKLVDYLTCLNIPFTYVEYVPNSIAVPALQYKIDKGIMMPQLLWNPSIKWKSTYTDNKEANLVSPFNIFIHATLTLDNPSNELVDKLIVNKNAAMQLKSMRDKTGRDIHISYNLLPDDNFNSILKTIEMIYRYI